MSKIFIFLLMAIANKLVRDNLPDLNLSRIFQKHIAPWLFIGYLHSLHLTIKYTKNPIVKRRLQQTLMALTVAIVLTNTTKMEK